MDDPSGPDSINEGALTPESQARDEERWRNNRLWNRGPPGIKSGECIEKRSGEGGDGNRNLESLGPANRPVTRQER